MELLVTGRFRSNCCRSGSCPSKVRFCLLCPESCHSASGHSGHRCLAPELVAQSKFVSPRKRTSTWLRLPTIMGHQQTSQGGRTRTERRQDDYSITLASEDRQQRWQCEAE